MPNVAAIETGRPADAQASVLAGKYAAGQTRTPILCASSHMLSFARPDITMPVLTNPKHERFAQALIQGMSQADAYEHAGFERDEGHASRLAGNGKVSARVRELNEDAAQAAGLSREWVLSRLMRNAERAMQAQAVMDEEGKPLGEYRYDSNGANRALELCGKELGMFVERTENLNINHDVSDKPLSAEQWAEQHATAH